MAETGILSIPRRQGRAAIRGDREETEWEAGSRPKCCVAT